MNGQFLRIGTRYINTAHISHVQENGASVVLTLSSFDSVRTDEDARLYESEYFIFEGNEARALLWWFTLNSIDVMNNYAEIVDLVDNLRDQSGALED